MYEQYIYVSSIVYAKETPTTSYFAQEFMLITQTSLPDRLTPKPTLMQSKMGSSPLKSKHH